MHFDPTAVAGVRCDETVAAQGLRDPLRLLIAVDDSANRHLCRFEDCGVF
jgi:hypothetical protein